MRDRHTVRYRRGLAVAQRVRSYKKQMTCGLRHPPHRHHRIQSTKRKRIADRRIDLALARHVGHVVEIASRIRFQVIDRRWNDAIADRADGADQFQRAACTECRT